MEKLPFRSEAVDELSAPEQLDEAIQVTSPMSWLAVTILLFILVATLIWSLFGTIHTRIQGDGMITYENARHIDIVTRHEGYVAELLVRDGDQVARGDIVARLDNDLVTQQHAHAVRKLQDIQREIAMLESERDADINAFTLATEGKRSSLTSGLSTGKALLDRLQKRIRDGKTGEDERSPLRRQALRAEQDMDRVRSELGQLEVLQNERISVWRKALVQANQRLARQQVETAEAAAAMETALIVRAVTDGKIVEVLAGIGTFLPVNTGIYRMTNQVSGLYAITFFSDAAAELIEPGMPAQVSLNTISREAFGHVRGVVRDVSRFRLSSDALMTLLGNRQLVEQFSRHGAPLAVEVDFVKGPDDLYEWTTGQSPPFEMEPGLLTNVSISIREQRPMTILIPALRGLLDPT